MRDVLRQSSDLFGRSGRGRWVIVIVFAALVSLIESVGALLILVILGLVTSGGSDVQLPIIGDIRERFPNVPDDRLFVIVAIFIGVFFVARAVVTVAQTYLQMRVANNAGVALSSRLVEGYLNMPYPFHLRRSSAELIRNAHVSVLEVVSYLFLPVVTMASELFLVAAISVVLIMTAPVATILTAVVLGPVIFFLVRAIQPRLASFGETNQEMAKESLSLLTEGLAGFRDITVLQSQSVFAGRFAEARAKAARAMYLRTTFSEIPRVVLETSVILFILGFLSVAVVGSSSPKDTVAILGLFAYAVLRLLPEVNRILANLGHLRYGAAAVRNVHADLKLIEKLVQPAGPSPDPLPFAQAVELRGVTFQHEMTMEPTLRDINLVLPKGSSTGIIGPTGGGKSTLVDLVLGLLRPSSGELLVDGRPLAGDERAWQRNLGVVHQTVFLLDATLQSNIAFGVPDHAVDQAALLEAIEIAQLTEFVASLPEGLATTVGERGVRLSGGQRQRVAIARALYRRPAVLVLDEGTSALDSATEHDVLAALLADPGRTIVMVAHRLTTVRACDRVVMVEGGEITDMGTFDELASRHVELRQVAG